MNYSKDRRMQSNMKGRRLLPCPEQTSSRLSSHSSGWALALKYFAAEHSAYQLLFIIDSFHSHLPARSTVNLYLFTSKNWNNCCLRKRLCGTWGPQSSLLRTQLYCWIRDDSLLTLTPTGWNFNTLLPFGELLRGTTIHWHVTLSSEVSDKINSHYILDFMIASLLPLSFSSHPSITAVWILSDNTDYTLPFAAFFKYTCTAHSNRHLWRHPNRCISSRH